MARRLRSPVRHVLLATLAVVTGVVQASARQPASAARQSDAGSRPAAARPGAWTPATAVFRFAVQSAPMSDHPLFSARACPPPAPDGADPSTPLSVDAGVLDGISAEMQKQLSKKTAVLVDPDADAVPAGALAVTGCVVRADKGNAAGRLVGMNVGASRLEVRVVALARTGAGWETIDTFDLRVKGGNLVPSIGPVGLAIHLAQSRSQSLSAGARKLARRIVERLEKDLGAARAEEAGRADAAATPRLARARGL